MALLGARGLLGGAPSSFGDAPSNLGGARSSACGEPSDLLGVRGFLLDGPSSELGDCTSLGRQRVLELGVCPKLLGSCPEKTGAWVLGLGWCRELAHEGLDQRRVLFFVFGHISLMSNYKVSNASAPQVRRALSQALRMPTARPVLASA